MNQTHGRLAGKIAVVTGAGRGIGLATARILAAEGATVLGCGRGPTPDGWPAGMVWHTADISRAADVERLRQRAEELPGRPVILVNNAGLQIERTLPESTNADWDLLIGANCRGVFNCCREFIPAMVTAGGGVIVNIGSISGNCADQGMALYNASKGFVHSLTRSIAVDHGPAIRCNAVSPGWIRTGMADAAFGVARDPAAAERDALRRHPAGRFGQPDDIASAVLWLVSDEAGFVTGQCITVDGGLTAGSPVQLDDQ
ncbi:MAG: SDR family NAD(P)-dependent oxidoreductase [Rhodobacteraceae bacterium]|nr:SDR family NAD(P)-dependent oxidoreductase [Paracoccaceae bacterium]